MTQVTSIANQAVFDLPWLVARQEGLFAQEDIEVVFLPQTPWDAQRPPETDPGQVPPFWQYTSFEARQAEAFNACEWGGPACAGEHDRGPHRHTAASHRVAGRDRSS